MSWSEYFACHNKEQAIAHIKKRREANTQLPQTVCDLIVAAIEAKSGDGPVTVETFGHLGPDSNMNASVKVVLVQYVG